MSSKWIVYALAVVWLALFVTSFVVFATTEASDIGLTRGLNRITAFLTWQAIAFVAAVLTWFFARRIDAADGKGTRRLGYAPLLTTCVLVLFVTARVFYAVQFEAADEPPPRTMTPTAPAVPVAPPVEPRL